MTQLKLDPGTHDLVLGEEVSDEEEIRQHLKIRLLLIRGEVKWNIDLGVPYLEDVMRKGVPPSRLVSIFRGIILGTPGINEITEGPTFDGPDANRLMALTFRANTDVGELDFTENLSPQGSV